MVTKERERMKKRQTHFTMAGKAMKRNQLEVKKQRKPRKTGPPRAPRLKSACRYAILAHAEAFQLKDVRVSQDFLLHIEDHVKKVVERTKALAQNGSEIVTEQVLVNAFKDTVRDKSIGQY